MRYIIILSIVLFLFSSCERDADIPLPKSEPKMALTCFLSPDSPIKVLLVKVNPIYNTKLPEYPDFIENATVYMTDGVDTVLLTLEPTQKSYYEDLTSKLKITGGKRYWVWANAPGLPTVSASTTIPKQYIKDSDLSSQFIAYTQGSDSAYQIQVSWKDIPQTRNYYRLQPWLIDSNLSSIGFNDYLLSYSSNREYVSDLDKDGQILDFVNESYTFYGNDPDRNQITTRTLLVYFLTTSEEYYKYHLSLLNYSGDSPFVNPSNRYTNIKGGFGVFAGFQMVKMYRKIF